MHVHLAIRVMLMIVSLAVLSQPGWGQDVVRTGPPPAIRTLIDGFVQAVNGGGDALETFAQTHFSPALLQKLTREDRADRHRQLVSDFGTVTLERVTRQGPDAPLELRLKGSKESGVVILDLDGGSPPRIAAMSVQLGDGPPREPGSAAIPPPPIDPTLQAQEIDRRLDAYFTKLSADGVFSGVALVARQGKPVFFRAYGLADREKRLANTVDTRFNLGSINKAFTQVAIRQLASEGKLAYTDMLGKFFPDYPQVASRVATIEQLLGHRGGLSDFFGPEFTRADKAQFASNADYFRFVSSLPPLFVPGERTQYCNGCYIALGAIVERVSGMPYEKYVAQRVFAPAGMTSTGYPRSDRPEADVALGYTRQGGDGSLRSNITMHGVAGSAAGGGYSTALDLLAYVNAVRAGRFPGAEPEMGIAGGAPGINANVEASGDWVAIVLTNFDPPTATRIGSMLADALAR